MRHYLYWTIVCVLLSLASCQQKQTPTVTPWGTVVGDTAVDAGNFSLDDIVSNGEMIVVTLSGPDTYYDYHGHGMGDQYLLCEKFAQQLGVSVRVEVCSDTTELVAKLKDGKADMVACQLPKRLLAARGLLACGATTDTTAWAVRQDSRELAETASSWYSPKLLAEVKREEDYLLSTRSVKRHVYSPMLNGAAGVISRYDGLFKRYAPVARVDWRLMAAQCYQESCFDPNAVSWAGARGLMQIMPTTADHLGLPRSMMHDPEASIAASAKYMAEMGSKFGDVPSAEQRMYYALACYNGGYHHIRDAMALARKHGRNPYRWDDVAQQVLNLSNPQYYRDPVVKYGYMRGPETVNYVARIRERFEQYRGKTGGGGSFGIGSENQTPHRSTHKHKYKI